MVTAFNTANTNNVTNLFQGNEPYTQWMDYANDIVSGFLPETIMIITILILCCITLVDKKELQKQSVIYTSSVGLILAMLSIIYTFFNSVDNPAIFSGMFTSDPLSIIFRLIMLISASMVLVFSVSYLEKNYKFETEFVILLFTATLGAMLMAGASDLIMTFIAMETLSVSSYLLTGYIRTDRANNEASLKYLIIGSAAGAILLFGMSYLYGITGTTLFSELSFKLNTLQLNLTLLILLILIIAGTAYKAALAPFHVWAPDVYQGAPTPYTAFLSVASKAAGFVLIIRIMTIVFQHLPVWQIIFAILAILSMVIGNLTALVQKDIKRLLAYSSIAHAGYIAIGLAVASEYSLSSMIYYLLVYLFMQLGAWCAIILYYNQTGSNKIDDYAGLIHKRPVLAISLALFLLSLAGIPITAGFFAKFFIFQAAILGGGKYMWLIIIALINSAISIYYYLYIIKTMVLREESELVKKMDQKSFEIIPHSKALSFVLGFTVTAVIVMGIFATPLVDLSKYSVEKLINYKSFVINSPTL